MMRWRTLLVLSLLLAFVAAVPAIAPAQQTSGESGYAVQPGDTLWWLEGYRGGGDPAQWRRLVGLNPFLNEPGRIFEKDGKIIVLIKPGEKLVGLETLGILPKVYPLPEFRGGKVQSGASPLLLWFWLVFGALAAAVIAFGVNWIANAISRYRRRRADPATAGPAFVAPEILRTPDLMRGRFDRMAEAEAARRDPIGRATVRPERTGPIESGFLTGRGRVHYADGSAQELSLNRQAAYRARYRMPDRSEEMLYSLAGCMNPVNLFQGDRTFAWTTQEVAVPAPAPQPEPAAPAPAPLRVVAGTPAPTVVAVGDLEFTVPHGSAVTVDGQSRVSIVPTPGTILVSRKAKAKRARPKIMRTAAAAGSPQQ